MTMTNDEIKTLALSYGFTERPQDNGEMDLNPYVYKFADKVGDIAYQQGFYDGVADSCRHHQCGWVSVSEHLPENKSVVLCYGEPYSHDKTSKPNSLIFCAVYVAEHKRWSVGYSAFGDTSSLEVKFWQPLPQPPNEV